MPRMAALGWSWSSFIIAGISSFFSDLVQALNTPCPQSVRHHDLHYSQLLAAFSSLPRYQGALLNKRPCSLSSCSRSTIPLSSNTEPSISARTGRCPFQPILQLLLDLTM